MDTSLVTAALGAQTGLTQLSLATSMLKMNADMGASVVKLIDGAQQTMNSLANVAAGIGTNLDIWALERDSSKWESTSRSNRLLKNSTRPARWHVIPWN
jgi:hypothetical protein